jgi:hypothetical protein
MLIDARKRKSLNYVLGRERAFRAGGKIHIQIYVILAGSHDHGLGTRKVEFFGPDPGEADKNRSVHGGLQIKWGRFRISKSHSPCREKIEA